MIKGFKNFLMRGDVVVVAVGLVVALAFKDLIDAFTANVIDPIVNRFAGSKGLGLGLQLGEKGNPDTFLNIGALITGFITFFIFMAVVYFLIVTPYKLVQARRGIVVFGDPAPVKTCPACLSDDLNPAASRCKYCGADQPAVAT